MAGPGTARPGMAFWDREGRSGSDRTCPYFLCVFDPKDVELRERLAESAYLRERYEDMVLDREFELREDAQYFAMSWSHLSGAAQRPYRIAVAVALEHVAELIGVG